MSVVAFTRILMKKIVRTYQEEKAATRPNVYRNKKKYRRKKKHPLAED